MTRGNRHGQDYVDLHQYAPDAWPDWLHDRFPDGAPLQWWLSMIERAESNVSPARRLTRDEARKNFEFALALLQLSRKYRGLHPCHSAYWMVRLVVMSLRYNPPVEGLPAEISPDRAAELALGSLPLSQEEALAVASRRRRELQQGVQRYYRRGDDISRVEVAADIRDLQEVERLVSSFAWIAEKIVDKLISRRVADWVRLLPRLEQSAPVD